jgi:hypothetical protein
MNESDRTERLDDDDHQVLGRLGYALARAQLFELALMKLLEAQRFNVNEPLEERWDEILGWMTRWTAGRLAKELHLPEAIAADLANLVRRRNLVAHDAWLAYLSDKKRHGGQDTAGAYIVWLDEQARYLGLAYDALIVLTTFERYGDEFAESGIDLDMDLDMKGKGALPVWRHSVKEPVPKADVPAVRR